MESRVLKAHHVVDCDDDDDDDDDSNNNNVTCRCVTMDGVWIG
jgi:hypothetical protein